MKKVLALLMALFLLMGGVTLAEEYIPPAVDEMVAPEPTKVTLADSKTVTVYIGTPIELAVTVSPEGADETQLRWSSSSRKIATVDNGIVTAVKEGTATITVKAPNGKKDAVKVKVVDPYKPAKIELDQSGTVGLNMGETLALGYQLSPETARAEVKWSTSSKKIAKVDENGVVTPVKEGTATITVKTKNGKKDTVKVKVIDPYKPGKIVLNESGTVTLAVGGTLALDYALLPETARADVKWKSSSKKVAVVDEQTGIVTAVKEGTATITVATHNGKKDTVKVKVVDPNKVNAIKINKTGTQKLKVGDTMQIDHKISPETAQTTLTWKSSKASVATVSETGLVTAVGKGTATITVTTHNGKKASVKVSVSEAPQPEITNPVGAKELSGYMGKPYSNLSKVVSGLYAERGGKYDVSQIFKKGAENEFWGFISSGEIEDSDSYTGGWKKDCIYTLQTKLSGYALHGFYVGMAEGAIEAQAEKMGYASVNAYGDVYRTYELSGKKIGDVNYTMMVYAKNGSVYAVRMYALKDGFWAP